MESSRRSSSSLKPSMSVQNMRGRMDDESSYLLPGLGVKWPSSWYVEGTSTTLALSAPDGWTNARRLFTQDTVATKDLRALFREILESMIEVRSKQERSRLAEPADIYILIYIITLRNIYYLKWRVGVWNEGLEVSLNTKHQIWMNQPIYEHTWNQVPASGAGWAASLWTVFV